MSWESSGLYYRLINEETKRRLGGHHNAQSLMRTIDFAGVERLQHQGEWKQLGATLADAARNLEHGGADFVVLCTNTMHKVADSITQAVQIPLLHIVDATAAAIQKAWHSRVGLLATKFTMEEGFYTERMQKQFGIEIIVPAATSRRVVHDIIYEELCHGVIRDDSRERYQAVIAELAAKDAEAIILGCTEIELLISERDSILPLYASTTIHAHAAVELALNEENAERHVAERAEN